MDQNQQHRPLPKQPDADPTPSPDKQPWQEPKLRFVEPTLTKHGRLEKVTGGPGFFGGFSPG